mmetsp:Transcript_13289/g.50861  ORF Transcript_13289/g.50861 Transcript_13289/m.50861 type:complete len:209 (+) Transcript_13289:143-769(+)
MTNTSGRGSTSARGTRFRRMRLAALSWAGLAGRGARSGSGAQVLGRPSSRRPVGGCSVTWWSCSTARPRLPWRVTCPRHALPWRHRPCKPSLRAFSPPTRWRQWRSWLHPMARLAPSHGSPTVLERSFRLWRKWRLPTPTPTPRRSQLATPAPAPEQAGPSQLAATSRSWQPSQRHWAPWTPCRPMARKRRCWSPAPSQPRTGQTSVR